MSYRMLVGVVLLATLVSPAAVAKKKGVKLSDTPVNVALDALQFDDERFLTNSATYQYNLASIIGHVLYPQKVEGSCGDSLQASYDAGLLSSRSYLKENADLEVKSVNQILYDSKTTRAATRKLGVFAFSASLSDERSAQVTITDAAFLSLPFGELIDDWNVQALEAKTESDCDPVLITGAKVRMATYKWFTKSSRRAGISVAVFSAEGELYAEDGQTQNEVLLKVDVVKVRPRMEHINLWPDEPEGIPAVIQVPDLGFPPHP